MSAIVSSPTSAASTSPPHIEVLQAARITARIGGSPHRAHAFAEIIFGFRGRDHVALLGDLTADRVHAAGLSLGKRCA